MAGLYFHIPFCKRACAYCDFYKEIGTRKMPQLIAQLHEELRQRKDYLQGDPLRTIYFGGGTPSLMSISEIHSLLNTTHRLFDTSEVEEITIEANPDDLNFEYLSELHKLGINRLSMGVQSLDDGCLKLMNRRHTACQAIQAVKDARRAGFDNITIDLIFGVPGFGGTSLDNTLRGFLDLDVEHISAYHLTIEPNTAFGRKMARGQFSPVEESISEEEFLKVHHTLCDAGYEHYEISNYARPNRRARHNASYWHGDRYLGIGPAAHSFDGEERHWNVSSVDRYLEGEPPEAEHLTLHDHYNEYLLTRLRTIEGIDLKEVRQKFGESRLAKLLQAARLSDQAHWLQHSEGRLAILPEHFLVSDLVIESLFEA